MKRSKRLVVIDGKSVFYRGYYAVPNLSTKDGTPTGGVFGFATMAMEVLKKMDPDYVCVAWDKPKTNIRRRREIYPEYKANRKPAPPDFYEQIPLLHELLEALSWPLYEIDDHEADDIMATLAVQADKKGFESIMITSDHDVLQLIDKNTSVAILKRGLTNFDLFDPALFKSRYQMSTEQFVDYKSLRGDPSDNIPGVSGVGEKTATKLIVEHGSMDGVYKNLDAINDKLRAKLEADKEMAYITKELVVLDKKVPIKMDWKTADINNLDKVQLVEVLRKLEFRSLLNQLPKNLQVSDEEQAKLDESSQVNDSKIDLIKEKADLKKVKLKSGPTIVHIWAEGSHGADLRYLLVSQQKDRAYLIHIGGSISGSDVAKLLNDNKLSLVGYNTKLTIEALLQLGVKELVVEHDVRMGAFLINSLSKEQSLTELATSEVGYEGVDLDNIPPIEIPMQAPKINSIIWGLFINQTKILKNDFPKVEKLASEIEWPLIPVLARMELVGIKLDTKRLKKMSKELEDSISDLQQSIYGHADFEFNISSPTQLSEVLFERLKLPTKGVKKTKTGYSTAARELDKLRDQHPIIDLISQYREVTKLKSTYVDTLPKMVDEDSRLHTTFSLAVAPTGRLSSHDPNLQNIPVRTELGNEIRRAFVASENRTFVSVDYSQFELRLAAQLANDAELIEAFNDGLDIHTRTASQVYGVAMEDVTKTQRRDAKVINFGILYGMSPHGLSQATDMTQAEAADFIERYFKLREPLLKYIEDTKNKAHQNGFVETLFGRRRPTPDVKSSNFVVRQAAERAAINHPIQGTEADLMKMAMVELEKKLPKDAQQILQIHDSILIECKPDQAKKVGQICQDVMENIYKLDVNLDVDVSIADNWGEL